MCCQLSPSFVGARLWFHPHITICTMPSSHRVIHPLFHWKLVEHRSWDLANGEGFTPSLGVQGLALSWLRICYGLLLNMRCSLVALGLGPQEFVLYGVLIEYQARNLHYRAWKPLFWSTQYLFLALNCQHRSPQWPPNTDLQFHQGSFPHSWPRPRPDRSVLVMISSFMAFVSWSWFTSILCIWAWRTIYIWFAGNTRGWASHPPLLWRGLAPRPPSLPGCFYLFLCRLSRSLLSRKCSSKAFFGIHSRFDNCRSGQDSWSHLCVPC